MKHNNKQPEDLRLIGNQINVFRKDSSICLTNIQVAPQSDTMKQILDPKIVLEFFLNPKQYSELDLSLSYDTFEPSTYSDLSMVHCEVNTMESITYSDLSLVHYKVNTMESITYSDLSLVHYEVNTIESIPYSHLSLVHYEVNTMESITYSDLSLVHYKV